MIDAPPSPPASGAPPARGPAEGDQRQQHEQVRPRRPLWLTALDWASLVAVVVFLTLAIRVFVAQAFYIPSGSMEPQLRVDDRIIVSRLSYRLHEPRRGDIVVFSRPDAPGGGGRSAWPVRLVRTLLSGVNLVKPERTEYVKRVVALPGERVATRDGRVHVDGHVLVEPYLPAGTRTEGLDEEVVVPEGHLFVLGDNRGSSYDSRFFGPIDQGDVDGRVLLRVWPLSDMSWL